MLSIAETKTPSANKSPAINTTGDLILGLQPSDTDYQPTFEGGPISNLTNGTTQSIVNGVPDGNLNDGSNSANAIFDLGPGRTPPVSASPSPWHATYTLDTTSHRNGYNITEIDSVTGHQDTRVNQTIDVQVLPVGADPATGWVDLATTKEDVGTTNAGQNNFAFRPNTNGGSGYLAITDTTGTVKANVAAIKFVALDDGAVFREFMVKGSVAPETSVPAAPPSLTATAGNNAVSLQWTAAPGAATYNVYRSTTQGGPYGTPLATGVTATTYNDTTATNGTKYYYVVAGVNPIGTGANSPEASATPQLAKPVAPTGVTATNQYQAVQVTWTAPPFATSYNVYRSTSATSGFTQVATGVTASTYNDTSAVGGTTYYYTVSAVNAAGEGPQSSASAALVALQGAEAHYYNQEYWVGTPIANALFDQAHTAINGIDVNWSLGPPTGAVTNISNFSTIFTGKVLAPTTGTYSFVTNTQDEGVLYVNGQIVSEDVGIHTQENATKLATIDLTAGQAYNFVFLQNKELGGTAPPGGAAAHLLWVTPDNFGAPPVVVPQSNLIAQSDLPAAPTGVTTTTTPDSVTLNWTDNSTSEIHYQVLRSTNNFSTPGTVVGQTFINATTFTDTTAAPGTAYQYEVVGVNFDGTGTPSAPVNVNTPARPATAGTLAGATATSPAGVDLTAITAGATDDWAHWGLTNATTFDDKSGGNQQISNFSPVGDTYAVPDISSTTPSTTIPSLVRVANAPVGFTWSDGNQDGSANASTTGIATTANPGGGFQVTAPADPTTRTLRVWVDETNAVGQLTAYLSDGSATPFVDSSVANSGGTTGGLFTITYHAASANQTLFVKWAMKTDNAIGTANIQGSVSIESATLSVSSGVLAPSNLNAGSYYPGIVSLSWSNNSLGAETGFGIEQSTDGGTTFTQVATAPAGSSRYDVTNLDKTGATQYVFRIRALATNPSNNSAYAGPTNALGATGTPNPSHPAPTGFTGQTDMSLNGSAATITDTGALQLTDGNGNEASTAFYNVGKVGVEAFTTTFDFQFTNPGADGFTFTLQNSASGPGAVGNNGGSLGYSTSGTTPGITPSVAVAFNMYNNVTQTALLIDGNGAGTGASTAYLDMSGAGINFHPSGTTGTTDVFHVQLSYDGTNLTETVTDTTTNAVYTHTYAANIPQAIGDNGAYAGFTGGTGAVFSTQQVLNWVYNASLPNVTPNQVTSVGITDNPTAATVTTGNQRSQVRGLVVKFASPDPSFAVSQLGLSLLNSGGSGANDNSAPTALSGVFGTPTTADGGLTWVVPFVASTANTSASGSLNDGIYTLNISGVSGSGTTSLTFHRLYGDVDGNKTVNPADYARLKTAFGSSVGQSGYNADLDFDNNGTINPADYAQFKTRFGKTFTYT